MPITFEIDGNPVHLGAIWVHLQEQVSSGALPYWTFVPNALAQDVFALTGQQVKHTDLPCHIVTLVNDLGTFIVEGFIEKMAKLSESELLPKRWVIATVDTVRLLDEGVAIGGFVVPFQPDKFPVFVRL